MYAYKLWTKILRVYKPSDNTLMTVEADTGKDASIDFLINAVSKGGLKCSSSGQLSITKHVNLDEGVTTLNGTVNATGWQTIFVIANLQSWLISATEDGGGNHGVFSVIYTNIGSGTVGNIQTVGITCQVGGGTNVQLNCAQHPYTWTALRLK